MRKKPDGYYDKFKKLSESENWKDDTTGWIGTIKNLTTELRNLDLDRLQKEKLEAQANLRYSELRNENSAIKYGLPIFTLVITVISLFLTLDSENFFSYHLMKIGRFFELNLFSSSTANANTFCIIMFLVVMVVAVVIVSVFCEICRINRQKEIIYYQIKLKIIEIVENEKKNNNKTTNDNKRKSYIVEVDEIGEELEEKV